MKPTLVRTCAAVALTGALVGAPALSGGPDGYAQEKAAPKPAVPAEPLGVLHCIGCHGGPDTPAYAEYSKTDGDKGARTDFVTLTEYHAWRHEDLHTRAFENIKPKYGPGSAPLNLATRMEEVLRESPSRKGKDYRVTAAAECLTCHATDLTASQNVALGAKTAGHFQTDYGVGCEGPATDGRADNWLAPHVRRAWREVAPKEKADLGLVDLRDPATRARTCASCHVGSVEEGRFVSHEIYAAGHPPLPPFELVTYCRDEPWHYYTHRENASLRRLAREQPEKALALFHYEEPADDKTPNGVSPDARDFAVGTVATFEAGMHLLATDAERTAKAGGYWTSPTLTATPATTT